MKMIHKDKHRHILYCEKTLREAELDAEKRSIVLIDNFNSLKKHRLNDLDVQPDKGD